MDSRRIAFGGEFIKSNVCFLQIKKSLANNVKSDPGQGDVVIPKDFKKA
jgi:hypothetical protein